MLTQTQLVNVSVCAHAFHRVIFTLNNVDCKYLPKQKKMRQNKTLLTELFPCQEHLFSKNGFLTMFSGDLNLELTFSPLDLV